MSANDSLRRTLLEQPDAKGGFLIYRCCAYDDGEKWERFMMRLKLHVRARFEGEELADVFDRLDWTVISSPELDGAHEGIVQEKFKEWLESGEEKNNASARFSACVMIEDANLDAVLELEPIEEFDTHGVAFVPLISANEEDDTVYVALSYLLPRAYLLLEGPGWEALNPDGQDVAMP